MAAFDSAAFSTSAFSVNAFDFGGTPPAPVVVVKTGTGGIDPGEGLRRVPFKPTGLLDKPRKGEKTDGQDVDARLEESAQIAAEIAAKLAREFGEETQRQEAKDIVEMSMAEVDAEIGLLLRKKLRTQEDEILLLLLMTAISV